MAFSELDYMQGMTGEQRMLFQTQMSRVVKNRTTGVLLALLLGGFGAHKFYMGKMGQGVLYLLFCWTFIPACVAFIEMFLMPGRVDRHNQENAAELAARVKALDPSAPPSA